MVIVTLLKNLEVDGIENAVTVGAVISEVAEVVPVGTLEIAEAFGTSSEVFKAK